MKYINLKIFAALIASLAMFSCEKDEDRVTFQGGTAPILAVSSTEELVLDKPDEFYQSLQFSWTNPQYMFSNGPNTQDVSYFLEIDTQEDFSSSKKVTLSIPSELFRNFTVKELNATLSGMELSDYEPHDFYFRVKSTLANGSVPLYSNVEMITISTYLDVVYPVPDKLYITGAATPASWMGGGDPPNEDQEFVKVNAYTFVLENIAITGGQGFLFVPVYGNWDNKYGFTGDGLTNNPMGDSFRPGGNDMISPASGNYKITVNFKTGKYTFEAI